MDIYTPHISDTSLCLAIERRDFQTVERFCQQRLEQMKTVENATFGYFRVDTGIKCGCFAIPNYSHMCTVAGTNESIAFTPLHLEAFIHKYSRPLKLREMICSGECTCKCVQKYPRTIVKIVREISPLVVACFYGQVKIVRYLLGVDPTALNCNKYMTPLMITALCRNEIAGLEIAKILLEAGADMNLGDRLFGIHPLELVTWKNSVGITRLLLENGVNPNSLKMSTLAFVENKQCVNLVIDAGFQVIHKSHKWCPMNYAVSRGKMHHVRTYLKSPTFRKDHEYSDSDETFVQTIYRTGARTENDAMKLLNMLLEAGLSVDSYKSGTITNKQMRLFTNFRFDADAFLSQVFSQLLGPATFLAVERGWPEGLMQLLKKGANVNFRNVFGMTALMAFAFWSPRYKKTFRTKTQELLYRKCFHILVQYGIDLNAKDICGRSAVYYAAASEEDDVQQLRCLLDLNVDLSSADKSLVNPRHREKRSAFYVACQYGKFKNARLLIDYGYNVRNETWLMNSRLRPHLLRQKRYVLREFVSYFRNPEDLMRMCRNKIRCLLGLDIATSSKQLGLPVKMEKYIRFE